jgi:hypothetical protein
MYHLGNVQLHHSDSKVIYLFWIDTPENASITRERTAYETTDNGFSRPETMLEVVLFCDRPVSCFMPRAETYYAIRSPTHVRRPTKQYFAEQCQVSYMFLSFSYVSICTQLVVQESVNCELDRQMKRANQFISTKYDKNIVCRT